MALEWGVKRRTADFKYVFKWTTRLFTFLLWQLICTERLITAIDTAILAHLMHFLFISVKWVYSIPNTGQQQMQTIKRAQIQYIAALSLNPRFLICK